MRSPTLLRNERFATRPHHASTIRLQSASRLFRKETAIWRRRCLRCCSHVDHAPNARAAAALRIRIATRRIRSRLRPISWARSTHRRSAAPVAMCRKLRAHSAMIAASPALASTCLSHAMKPPASCRSSREPISRSSRPFCARAIATKALRRASRWRERVSRSCSTTCARSRTADAVACRQPPYTIRSTPPRCDETSRKALRLYSASVAALPSHARHARPRWTPRHSSSAAHSRSCVETPCAAWRWRRRSARRRRWLTPSPSSDATSPAARACARQTRQPRRTVL